MKRLVLIILVAIVASCSGQTIPEGEYRTFSCNLTQKAFDYCADSGIQMPVLVFHEDKTISVVKDFPWKSFSDSVYRYRLKNGEIRLRGKTNSIKFEAENRGNGSWDFLLEDDYVSLLTIQMFSSKLNQFKVSTPEHYHCRDENL